MRRLALAALLGGAGCSEAGGPAAGGPVPMDVVEGALASCLRGDPARGVATLDSLVARAPASVDALATRGLCRWTLFAADSSAAQAEGALADFTAAIAAAEASPDGPYATPLDRIYSHRAFAARTRGDGWEATIADLSSAIAAAPADPTHRLDRGVAYRLAGDSVAARTDLETFLSLADADDDVRRDMVAEMLDEMTAAAGVPEAAAGS